MIFAHDIGGKNILTGSYNGETIDYVDGEIIIGLKKGVSQTQIDTLLNQYNLTILRPFSKLRMSVVEIPQDSNLFQTIDMLNNHPFLKYAEPNGIDYPFQTHPNDPYYEGSTPATYTHQWALHNTGQSPPSGTTDADIDAPEAWDYETGDSSVIIAIIDSGIPLDSTTTDLIHPDLNDPDRFIFGPNISEDEAGLRDLRGHGTPVTGIIAAETNNDTGIAGIMWDCKLQIIKVFTYSQGASWEDIHDAILAAIDSGAQIINYSGGGSHAAAKQTAVDSADSAGIVQIYASGNTGSGADIACPAHHSVDFESVIAVGATDKNDCLSSFSSYASSNKISVVAPGGSYNIEGTDTSDVFSTTPNYSVNWYHENMNVDTTYGYMWGTSFAAPHVSGLAGLILSKFPSYSPADVRNLIEQSAEDVNSATDPGEDNKMGWGRINAFYALAPPAAPTSVTISGSVGQHPTITWQTSPEPDVDQYKIYRKRIGQDGDYVYRATINAPDTSYTDNGITVYSGKDAQYVYYKVKAVDVSNQLSPYSSWVRTKYEPPESKLLISPLIPSEYKLHANHPNPFNPITSINFDLPEKSITSLVVYDLLGRQIKTLVNGLEQPGFRQITWNGTDQNGRSLTSGMYIYRLTANSQESEKTFTKSQKMILLK